MGSSVCLDPVDAGIRCAIVDLNLGIELDLGTELGSPPPPLDSAMAAIGRTVVALRETLNPLRRSTDNFGAASSEIAVANRHPRQRTGQTASRAPRTASATTPSAMDEVAASVERMPDPIGQITTASGKPGSAIAPVHQPMAPFDRTTPRNAALVEPSSAAAERLQGQAQALSGVVASWRTSRPVPAHSFDVTSLAP